jgi:Protein of unknown function (DUF2939)
MAWESRSRCRVRGVVTKVLHRLQSVFRRLMWLTVAIIVSYTASPFLAAFLLHSAIKRGDTYTVQHRVDWLSVRESLKVSINQRLAEQGVMRADTGLWSAVKHELVDYVSPMVIDYMVDAKVTAEGFIDYLRPKAPSKANPTLATVRGRWSAIPVDEAVITLRPPLVPDMLKRIERAQFSGLGSFEFDVRDKVDPGRRYRATFEFRRYQWQLTRVEVLSLGSKAL